MPISPPNTFTNLGVPKPPAGQSGRKSIFWFTQGLPPVVLWGDGINNTMDKTWQDTIASLNDANVAVNTVDNNGVGGPPRFWGRGTILMQKQLAEETGGKSYYYRNDLDGVLAEGISDSRAGYVLGFYLTQTDGEYHTLKVRVDKPGLDLKYRRGYETKI
jgi:VWFA-related protein